jgi:hypothetical protein
MSKYLPERFHEWKNGICVDCGATLEEVRANSIKVPHTKADVKKLARENKGK